MGNYNRNSMVESSKPEEGSKPFHWPPLESNPDIFTQYMAVGGLPPNWCFGELLGLDDDLLAFVPRPVLAVIINAQYLKKGEEGEKVKGSKETVHDWYMHQSGTLDNACGVIACIHSIFNNLAADKIVLEENSVLKKLLDAT